MNGVFQIAAAVKQFHTEYGRFPPVTANGSVLEVADNTRLFNILRALDPEANPKRIVFFESRNALTRKGRLVAGCDPTGTFLDPWGNHYRIAIDSDYDGKLTNTYKDGEGAIRLTVIAWSLGPDGAQAERLRDGDKRADDIVSWESFPR